MLRNILLTLGGTLIAGGLVVLWSGSTAAFPPAIVAMIWGAIMVFGIVYERYVYKSIVDRPPTGNGWSRTTECFIDDKSGKMVRVYVKPLTGERAYVVEPAEAN